MVNEWRVHRLYQKANRNKTRKKKREIEVIKKKLEKKRKKNETEETFAGSLSVNHNLLRVGYGRERECAILQWLSLPSQL